MAWRLKDAGHDAIAVGWQAADASTQRMLFEWADRIVVMWDRFESRIPVEFRAKMMTCNVGDDRWVNSRHPELVGLVTDWIKRELPGPNPL